MKGAIFHSNNEVSFSVWAPFAKSVDLQINETLVPLKSDAEGVYQGHLTHIEPGTDYAYLLNKKETVFDPASRWQPQGVHGPSRILNPLSFNWDDNHWKSPELKSLMIYELHIGTFTEEGTFESAIKKIPHLKDLGINAIELMPVSSFPGSRNWGYDGVFPYAPQESYGGPNGLKALINACHKEEIAVILDVVYNHFGPEGAVFHQLGPYFTDKYQTPWGKAINYDGPYSQHVRDFVIHNALYWKEDYHIDGLRLDAVHAIYDFGAYHILQELHDRTENLLLIAESDLNDTKVIKQYHLDAQWNDDFHHSLHTLITKDRKGYYLDFGKISDFEKSITKGYVYDGQYSQYRKRKHGNPSEKLEGKNFIVCIQNHDQIPNASGGRRISELVTIEQLKLAVMLVIFSPNIPMLFMGEEWGASTRFHFFTNFEDPNLAKAVTEGRKKECQLEDFCDPEDLQTFLESKIDWGNMDQNILTFYKELISLRKQYPCLSNCRKDLTHVQYDEDEKWMKIYRSDPAGSQGLITVNFSDKQQDVPLTDEEKMWKCFIQNTTKKSWSCRLYIPT